MNGIYQLLGNIAKLDPNAIQKALTTASGVGQGFSPQSLEKNITDTVIKMQPEIALLTGVSIASRTHDFNRKTAHPAPGGAQGESSTTLASNSKNALDTVSLKIIKRKGVISGFLKDVSREYMNVQQYEMQNQIQAHALDLRYNILSGNAVANPYEMSGMDYYIATNRFNKALGGEVPTSLSILDNLLDANKRLGGAGHKKVFGMSPEMLSVISRLETTVRKTSDVTKGAFGQITVAGGWVLESYRGIPIIETTATRPIEQMRPTVTLAADAGGLGVGTMSNGTYSVMVAPITYEGEQLASDSQDVVLNAGTAYQRIKITLSDIHKDANGNVNCYGYRIYVSAAGAGATACFLKKIVPAYNYDSDGSIIPVTTSFNGKTGYDIYIASTTAESSVTTAMSVDRPYKSTGSVNPESIYLWDLDPIQGLGKFAYSNTGGSAFSGMVTVEELAKIEDYNHFLIKTYGALVPAYEATSALVRGLRTA